MREPRFVSFHVVAFWLACLFVLLLIQPLRVYSVDTAEQCMRSVSDFQIGLEPGESRREFEIVLSLSNSTETTKWLLMNPFDRNDAIAFYDATGERLYLDSDRMTTYGFEVNREDYVAMSPSETLVFRIPVQRRFGLVNGVASGVYFGSYFYFPQTGEFLKRRGRTFIEARGFYELIDSEVEVAESSGLPLLFATESEHDVVVCSATKVRLPE